MRKFTKYRSLLALLLALTMIFQQSSSLSVLAAEEDQVSVASADASADEAATAELAEQEQEEVIEEEPAEEPDNTVDEDTGDGADETPADDVVDENPTEGDPTEGNPEDVTPSPEVTPTVEPTEAPELTVTPEPTVTPTPAYKTDFTYTDGNVTVTATASEEAKFPENTELRADYLAPGTEAYEAAIAAIKSSLGIANSEEETRELYGAMYDVYFLVDGQRVEPDAGMVNVVMSFAEPVAANVPEEAEVVENVVMHVDNSGNASDVKQSVNTTDDGAISEVGFNSDSFSPIFAGVVAKSGYQTGQELQLENIALITPTITENGKDVTEAGVKVGREDNLQIVINYVIANIHKPTSANDVIKYTLPTTSLTIQNVTEGTVYSKANVAIGTYSITDGVLSFSYTAQFLNNNTNNIEGYFKIDAKVTTTNVEAKKTVEIKFDGVTESITINLQDGTVSGRKEYTINPDGTVTFKITLTPNIDINSVTLTDVMGSDFKFVKNSFALDGTSIPDNSIKFIDSDNKAEFSIGPLNGNETYVITYNANVVNYENSDNKNRNRVDYTWTSDVNNGSKYAETWPNLTQTWIGSKTGSLDKANGIITWTIKLNTGTVKGDMGNAVIKDRLDSQQSYDGTATVIKKSADGDTTKDTDADHFTPPASDSCFYKFPSDAGKCEYWIVYTTKIKSIPTVSGTTHYTNDVTITPDGGSESGTVSGDVSYVVGAAGVLDKTCTEKPTTTAPYTATWQSVIDVTSYSGGVTGLVYYDTIQDAYVNNVRIGSKIIEDSVKIVDSDNRTLEVGSDKDYTIEFHKYSSSSSLSGNNYMKIVFNGTVTKKLTVTYNTETEEIPFNIGSVATIKNEAHADMWYQGSCNFYQDEDSFTIDGQKTPFTKYADSPQMDNSLNAYTIQWKLLVNANTENDGTGLVDYGNASLTVEDTLPSTLTYITDSATVVTNTQWSSAKKIEPDIKDNKLTWTFDNVGKSMYYITFKTKVDPDSYAELITNSGVTYTNNAVLKQGSDVIGESTASSKLNKEILTKSGKAVDHLIEYSIDVNKGCVDLLKSEDRITMTDVIPNNVSLVMGSLFVYEGGTTTPLDSSKYSVGDFVDNTLTVTLPDETYVTLVYKVQPIGNVGEWITVENRAVLSGKQEIGYTDEHSYQIQNSSASASGDAQSISIHKTDANVQNPTALADAVFELYKVDVSVEIVDLNGTWVDTQTTDASGNLTFVKDGESKLHDDTLYYFVEKTQPTGYQLDTTKHYFILKGNAYSKICETIDQKNLGILYNGYAGGWIVSVVNEAIPVNGSLEITKEFVGLVSDNLTNAQKEEIEFTVTGPNSYTNTVKYSDFTEGNYTITNLPVGTYTVEETSNYIPEGSGLTVTYNVAGGSTAVAKNQTAKVTVTNTYNDLHFTVNKTDLVTDEEVDGATLAVYGKDENDEYTEKIDEWESAIGKTHDFGSKLEAGKDYILKETIAPEGYAYVTDIPFTMNEDGSVTISEDITSTGEGNEKVYLIKDAPLNIKVNKTDLGGNEVPNATIALFKEDGKTPVTYKNEAGEEVSVTWVSKKEETVDFGQYLKAGETYVLKETIAPSGYYYASDITFTVNTDGTVETTATKTYDEKTGETVILVQDAPIPSDVPIKFVVNKTDLDGNEVEGATIEIIDNAGKVVDTWVSKKGENHDFSDKLTKGQNYILRETIAPDGYAYATDISFSVSSTGRISINAKTSTDGNGNLVYLVEDAPLKLNVNKTDLDGKEVEGATLVLYDESGKEIDSWISKSNETHDFGSKLVAGNTYVLKETIAPEGYLYATDITFKVNKNGTVETTAKASKDANGNVVYLMEDAPSMLGVNKTDVDGKEVEGATLVLYDKDGKEIDSWVSKKGEVHFFKGNLTAGETYTLKETVAPDGYAYATDITFTVNADGTVTTTGKTSTDESGRTVFLVEDAPLKFIVNKTDLDGRELAGATIAVIDKDGNLVDSWISKEGEPHDFGSVLKAGETYTLREIVAPNGYAYATDITFTVNADGTVTTTGKTSTDEAGNVVYLVEDAPLQKTQSSIFVTKTLTRNGEAIGALDQTFYVALFADEACTQRLSDIKAIEFKNASSSSVEFTNIQVGKTYYIGEVDANGTVISTGTTADGTVYYANFTEGQQAVVTDEGGNTTITFENEFYDMPDGFYKDGIIKVTKNLIFDGTTINAVDQTFYVALFADQDCTEMVSDIMPVEFKNGSSSTVEFDKIALNSTYYVAEVDEDGNVLESGAVEDGTVYYANFNEGNEAVITEDGGTTTVTFDNEFMEMPDGFYKDAEITITKKLLTSTGAAKNSNSVFYAGIFEDEDFTTLAEGVSNNIVALNLNGTASATVKVALELTPGEETIYYITEVDKNGTPVSEDSSFAYDVTVDSEQVTLSEASPKASVTITNQETSSSSSNGSGGSSSGSTTSTKSAVKTGDNTPIALYVGLLLAAIVILGGIIVYRKKNKK